MSDRRRQLYAITRELRRWLEWQGADEDTGVIPASEQQRQKHRERAKARRRSKREAIQSSFCEDEADDDREPVPSAESGPAGEADETPGEEDGEGVWRELGSLRTGGGGSEESDEASRSQAGASGGGGDGTPETNVEKLQWLRNYMGDCRRCPLWKDRTNLVFGEGDPEARLVFVGEAPGYHEDQEGRPFVGRAGTLLDKMIRAMGLEREKVYICNVLKSRPPDNRDPRPDEVAECKPFLLKQLNIIEPEVIVTLGRPATQNVLETDRGIGRLRGKWHEHDGTPVMPTYHPAYLLRNESQKRKTWNDLQLVMERLGIDG